VSHREQLIIDLWSELGKESVGATDLELIQKTLIERLGAQASESPAAIARTLADHGVRLKHPEILETDARWRERDVLQLFASHELNFATIEAAVSWIEKLGASPPELELRRSVLQIKAELELVAASKQVPQGERQIAGEVAHWLTVWLQNPPIFADWLTLRRQSPDFRDRFKS
jgi:hypothetical protein